LKFLFVFSSIIRQDFPSGMFPLVRAKFKIWPVCVRGIKMNAVRKRTLYHHFN
jgi:hypothetical protein